MKKINITALTVLTLFFSTGCADFLDRESQSILSDEQVFSDQNMITSVLANYYGRIDWGQSLERNDFAILDEACYSSGGVDNRQDFGNDLWRVYDYTLIRHINQFLKGIHSSAAENLSADYRNQIEGEARFIRAWTYFNMCRCMGGMPIVGDEVFEYSGTGTDITAMQYPRSTESELYDYIINECTAIAALLPAEPTINAARANKWAALMLKARAAVYAASIAKYSYLAPDVKTPGGEVGIDASKAAGYYQTAYSACLDIIGSKKYELYQNTPDRGANFYEAVCSKSSGEVIWAQDYKYPGNTTGFTNGNISTTMRGDIDANIMTPTLNLVEAFEYVNDRDGALKTRTADNLDYIYYDKPEDLFVGKDPRLYGTVVYPGSDFNGTTIVYQAGQKYMENGKWTERTKEPGSFDDDRDLITSENGPDKSESQYVNNSGFNIRKFIDYNRDASTRGRGSDMWFVRMRYAEVMMIAAEAALELGKPQQEVCGYINQIRDRAGIQKLSSVSIDDIIRERRVEFAYENHRWWDLRRLRRAHTVWTGIDGYNDASHWALFPYRIKDPNHPQNGKWVFDKLRSTWTTMHPRRFEFRNYYNFINQDWINNNPKYVKNPYQ